jgi:hypothetical protein
MRLDGLRGQRNVRAIARAAQRDLATDAALGSVIKTVLP